MSRKQGTTSAWRFWRIAGAATAMACGSGCASVSYYGQAMEGQLEIFRKQKASEEVIADAATDGNVKRKLELVAELREFAETELDLPPGDNFTQYADLGRDHVVWSIFAAPEFSLEPKRWWYPVIGKLSYRGFFREELANAEGRELEEQGYDVYVGGVDAYSTLGWFSDPVLNTFIEDPDVWLAELVFHELTHRKLYVSGETDFNEALATAVGQEGVRRWLKAAGRFDTLRTYEGELDRRHDVYALIGRTRDRLEVIYGSGRPEEEKRRLKEQEFALLKERLDALRASWGTAHSESHWFEEELNNAHLNATATYHERVPMFEALLASKNGDLNAFFEEVKRLGKETKATGNRRYQGNRGAESRSGRPLRRTSVQPGAGLRTP